MVALDLFCCGAPNSPIMKTIHARIHINVMRKAAMPKMPYLGQQPLPMFCDAAFVRSLGGRHAGAS
jgi:hypothetical protein